MATKTTKRPTTVPRRPERKWGPFHGGVGVAVWLNEVETEEGKKYLEENLKVANSLAIGSSPTWLANSKYKFAGIDAQTIKTNLCAHNPTLKGCDKTLSANTQGVPAGGCEPAK